MLRTFKIVKQVFDLVVMRKPEIDWFDLEGFPGGWLGGQSLAQEMIHHLLERPARSPQFLFQESGDVIIEG